MIMTISDRWHCTNPGCRCEVTVEVAGRIEGDNPRCACGGVMKKRYVPPALSYLEFLRTDKPLATPRGSREG